MRALCVILIIIAFIALLLHIPVRIKVYAKYENREFINDYIIKYGFITIKKRKTKEKKDVPRKEEKADKKEKTSPLNVIKFIRENVDDIKRLITDVVGYTTKKLIRFEAFSLDACVGTDDAMNTALIYGGASAFIYNAVGVLERNVKMNGIRINFQPDFTESKIFIEFQCIIKTRIHNVLGWAFLALRRALPILKKRGEMKNGKSY